MEAEHDLYRWGSSGEMESENLYTKQRIILNFFIEFYICLTLFLHKSRLLERLKYELFSLKNFLYIQIYLN